MFYFQNPIPDYFEREAAALTDALRDATGGRLRRQVTPQDYEQVLFPLSLLPFGTASGLAALRDTPKDIENERKWRHAQTSKMAGRLNAYFEGRVLECAEDVPVVRGLRFNETTYLAWKPGQSRPDFARFSEQLQGRLQEPKQKVAPSGNQFYLTAAVASLLRPIPDPNKYVARFKLDFGSWVCPHRADTERSASGWTPKVQSNVMRIYQRLRETDSKISMSWGLVAAGDKPRITPNAVILRPDGSPRLAIFFGSELCACALTRFHDGCEVTGLAYRIY